MKAGALRLTRSVLPAAVALLLAACASAPHRGGFYQEDGPPEHAPDNLLATPDAVPRPEPLNAFANRPYVALGHNYVPQTGEAPFRQRGVASWYGRQFQGNRTASGERYDMFAMTAAHPTLPIPSYARVTNLRDGRSVVVRINDRGPFYRDRIIDLSFAAAARLGLAGPGSGEVQVERILPSSSAHAGGTPAPVPPLAAALPAEPAPAAVPETPVAVAFAVAAPASAGAAAAVSELPAAIGVLDAPVAASGGGQPRWSVQLGAFAYAVNAEALRDRLALLLSAPEASSLPPELRQPRIERAGGISRVLVGTVADRAIALQASRLLEQFLARPTALYVQ